MMQQAAGGACKVLLDSSNTARHIIGHQHWTVGRMCLCLAPLLAGVFQPHSHMHAWSVMLTAMCVLIA